MTSEWWGRYPNPKSAQLFTVVSRFQASYERAKDRNLEITDPVATMASTGGLDTDPVHVWRNDSIEERIFGAALICLEGHYMQSPVMGPQSISKVMGIVSKTLEKTHTFKDVRYVLYHAEV